MDKCYVKELYFVYVHSRLRITLLIESLASLSYICREINYLYINMR